MWKNQKFILPLLLVFIFFFTQTPFLKPSAATNSKSKSQQYIEAMGQGWNLGNTFDSFDTTGDKQEESWGNPKVTKELLHKIKETGFDSIRIPMTTVMRIGNEDTNFAIDESFLDRYEEVVNWALDEGFYVMINVHHDSWNWLKNWSGSSSAYEYKKYVSIWTQLSERFKNYDDHLMFESINEPDFWSNAQNNLNQINQAFYDIVRNSGGNNESRMLVLPTLATRDTQECCDALYSFIQSLHDENIIATFHYYSEWVYSANLGKTRFDEVLWDTTTPRTSLESSFDRIYNTFTKNGIGVVCGEYGLLGFDNSDYCNEHGETVKYIDYINKYARDTGICLMLWDNGQHMNRTSLEWNNKNFGEIIESSMTTRSSYATGLDYSFVNDATKNNAISIPMTMNGNSLIDIYHGSTKLVRDSDYTFINNTVTINDSFVSQIATGTYDCKCTLTFKFSSGADWLQHIAYTKTPVLQNTTGTKTNFSIPTSFNGDRLEKAESKNSSGSVVSNNSWWPYLQYDYEVTADYSDNKITLLSNYLNLLSNGNYLLTFTFYSGATATYRLDVDNDTITGTFISSTDMPTPIVTTAPTSTPIVTTAPTSTPIVTTTPTSTPIITTSPDVTEPPYDERVSCEATTSSDWGTGCIVQLKLTNTSGIDFTNGWTLEFDYERPILSVWGATFVSQTDDHCIITNPSWNSTWKNGDTILVSFMGGTGEPSVTASNFTLH